jgi:hypothetical protein
MTMPLLYESLSVWRASDFHAITRVLEKKIELGAAVKRVDFGDRYLYMTSMGDENVAGLAFESLFSKCPNIRVLIFVTNHNTRQLLTSRLAPVVTNNCPNVRHIFWIDDDRNLHASFDTFTLWMPCFRQLQVLSLAMRLPDNDASYPAKIHLPYLHPLEIFESQLMTFGRPKSELLIDWELPSLRRLICHSYGGGDKPTPALKYFSAMITSLHVEKPADPAFFLKYCPLLQELFITAATKFPTSDAKAEVHNSLQRVVVRMFSNIEVDAEPEEDVRATDDWISDLNDCMDIMSKIQGADLKSIRLVDFSGKSWGENDWRPSQAKDFQRWIDYWAKTQVRFENSEGELISVPPYIDYDGWDGPKSMIPLEAWVLYEGPDSDDEEEY